MHCSVYKYGLVLFSMLSINYLLFSQQDSTGNMNKPDPVDTTWFTDLSNQFVLRVYSLYKTNNVDVSNDSLRVKYRPNGAVSLGIGFNYKGLGLGVSFGVPLSQERKEKYGNTKRFDVQFSLYSKRIGMDGFFQAYRGYYIGNPQEIDEWDHEYFPALPDMRVLTLGFNMFYIFNNKKFSYKSAFVRNQVQNKSAGTITAGLFGNYDAVMTNNGFIPVAYPDSIAGKFDLKEFQAITIGLSVGYMYNFVISPRFFINLAAVPGLGYRHYEIKDLHSKSQADNKIAFHLLARAAIAYDHTNWFLNFTASFNFRNYNYKSYDIEMSTEQLRLTFGWRFQERRVANDK